MADATGCRRWQVGSASQTVDVAGLRGCRQRRDVRRCRGLGDGPIARQRRWTWRRGAQLSDRSGSGHCRAGAKTIDMPDQQRSRRPRPGTRRPVRVQTQGSHYHPQEPVGAGAHRPVGYRAPKKSPSGTSGRDWPVRSVRSGSPIPAASRSTAAASASWKTRPSPAKASSIRSARAKSGWSPTPPTSRSTSGRATKPNASACRT